MEDIQDKIHPYQRAKEFFFKVHEAWEAKDQGKLLEYVAGQIEMAYIAGANNLNLSGRMVLPSHLKDTGEVRVAAGNYVKDKGYKL